MIRPIRLAVNLESCGVRHRGRTGGYPFLALQSPHLMLEEGSGSMTFTCSTADKK